MTVYLDNKNIYDCSKEELKIVQHELGRAWSLCDQKEALKFTPNDTVRFSHRGMIITGSVTKINQKTVGVRSINGVNWKVSPTLLTKVE